MFYSIVFRHHVTKSCQSDWLELFHLALPEKTSNLPTSNYLMQRALNVDFEHADKFYYCSTCEGPLTGKEENELCQDCNLVSSKKALDRCDKYFYLLDMRQVLSYTLEIPVNGDEVVLACQKRSQRSGPIEVMTDVTDGACYQSLGIIIDML